MPRSSERPSGSSKKVARAARAGRRSRATAERSLLFPASVAVVVVLGVALVLFGRSERQSSADDTPPTVLDHWHAAYGINICGRWLDPLTDTLGDRYGIHTHGDGVMHIHPRPGSTGRDANVGRFAAEVGLELEDDAVTLPDGTRLADGDTCPDSTETGTWRLVAWEDAFGGGGPDAVFVDDFDRYRPPDGSAWALVFGPEDLEVQRPPSVSALNNLTDVAPTVPPSGTGTTGGSTTTTAGEGTTTTTDGSTATTTAGEGTTTTTAE